MPDGQTIRITLPPLNITIKDGQQATLEWAQQDSIPERTPPSQLPDNGDSSSSEIVAYQIGGVEGWAIEPASPRRDWMDRIPHGFAYRCLPLVMANQLGWVVRCPTDFEVVWNGTTSYLNSMEIRFPEGDDRYKNVITSHFGHGILTFSLPWLFRTPKGIALMVRGTPNFFKVNAAPLDGAIETEWSPYSFTMNWKIVEKNIPVTFSKGDPICAIVPYPLDLIENLQARYASLDSDPALKEQYIQWCQARNAFNTKQGRTPQEWQKYYYGGKYPDTTPAPTHRTALKLSRFQMKPSL